MRRICQLKDENKANLFSRFLKKEGIKHELEMSVNKDWGSDNYGDRYYIIWIIDEDRVDEALQWFQKFEENPDDPIYQSSHPSVSTKNDSGTQTPESLQFHQTEKRAIPVQEEPVTYFTWYILFTCTFLFFWGVFNAPVPGKAYREVPYANLVGSPIKKALVYDYPQAFTYLEKALALYDDESQTEQGLEIEKNYYLGMFQKTPRWLGFYSKIVDKLSDKTAPFKDAPLFEKIGKGEVWRLISPAFLHSDIFHLVFNMIWLVVLGAQIETRLRDYRFPLLIAILAIFSNTAQYLMSGAAFLGFSGVLCGLFTFMLIRMRVAPWEGYQLQRSTRNFLIFAVLAMFVIQFFGFLYEISNGTQLPMGIANTAHLSGAAAGFFLAYFPLFDNK